MNMASPLNGQGDWESSNTPMDVRSTPDQFAGAG